jgi:membrane protease YdiL (CAAX protease family)
VTDAPIDDVIEAPPPPHPTPTWPTWVEILLCSGYPTQIIISYALIVAGIPPTTTEGKLSGVFVFALSLLDTVALLSLIVLFIRRRGQRARDVFVGDTQPMREVAVGALSLPMVIIVVVSLTLIIRQFLPSLHNVPDNPLEGLLAGQASIWMFLFVVIVAGGVREELQRAFLLQRFRDDLGQPWLGLFITSLAFGMGHTLQGLDAAVITGTLGAMWGFIYLTRRGALAPMVSHSLFNCGELLRVFLQ